MDWKGFWTRVEPPFPKCSSRIHLPFLGSRRVVSNDCKRNPLERPHGRVAIDNAVADEKQWQSDPPSSNTWKPLSSELPGPAKLEGQTPDATYEESEVPAERTYQESEDPADVEPREHESPTASTTREQQVFEYASYTPERSAFKKIRRVHFSMELSASRGFTEDFTGGQSSVSAGHQRDFMANLKLDGVTKTRSSKLGASSTFPVPSRRICGPWNYNFATDLIKSSRHHDIFKLEDEPCTCNLSMKPTANLPNPQTTAPILASPVEHSEPHKEPRHSCHPRFCKIEPHTKFLHDNAQKHGETPQSLVTTCPPRANCAEETGKWEKSNAPEVQRPMLRNDAHAQTSLRNCSALLSGAEPDQSTANIMTNPEPLTQYSRVAGVCAVDGLGNNFGSGANLPKNAQRCDLRSDAQDATHAPQVTHKPHAAQEANRYSRARKRFLKFRKGGNKTPKSAYWFDVPYTSDADLPDTLLDRLQKRAGTVTSDLEFVANVGDRISEGSYRVDEDGLSGTRVGTPDPRPVVDTCCKSSKPSHVSDKPHSPDEANLPAGLSQGRVTPPDSEPLEDVVDNRTKTSSCFGVPNPANADLPKGLLQKGVSSSDLEPAEDFDGNRAVKHSKRPCWFGVSHSPDAASLAELLQFNNEPETPNSGLADADGKPSKSSCWFDLRPCSTVENLTSGLPPNGIAIPHSEHVADADGNPSQSSCWLDARNFTDVDESTELLQNSVSATDSKPAVDIGSKPSKTSYWSDVPYATSNLPARSKERGVATPDSEPPFRTPKGSYSWFDVPYPTEANLPAWLSQRRLEARNSKPSQNLSQSSKSSYWFDVPYSTEADLPDGLLQRLRVASPDIELSRRVEVDNKRRSTREVGCRQLRRVNAQSEVRHRAVMTMAPSGKVYPGEFCPSFTLCPGDILMTRNLRTEQSLRKSGGYVTLFPDRRYFEENGVKAAGSSEYYHFNPYDMVLRFGQFDDYDDWKWVPSPYLSLFMYAPPENSRSATGSWWLVDSKPSVVLPAPDLNWDRELASVPLNSRYIRCFHLMSIQSFRCTCRISPFDGRKKWFGSQVVYVLTIAFSNVKKQRSVASFSMSFTTLVPPIISVDYSSASPGVLYPCVVWSVSVTSSQNLQRSNYVNFGFPREIGERRQILTQSHPLIACCYLKSHQKLIIFTGNIVS